MYVHRIVRGWIRQEQSRGYDILSLHGRQHRVTWHQVFHRRPSRASRVNRLYNLQTFVAHLLNIKARRSRRWLRALTQTVSLFALRESRERTVTHSMRSSRLEYMSM